MSTFADRVLADLAQYHPHLLSAIAENLARLPDRAGADTPTPGCDACYRADDGSPQFCEAHKPAPGEPVPPGTGCPRREPECDPQCTEWERGERRCATPQEEPGEACECSAVDCTAAEWMNRHAKVVDEVFRLRGRLEAAEQEIKILREREGPSLGEDPALFTGPYSEAECPVCGEIMPLRAKGYAGLGTSMFMCDCGHCEPCEPTPPPVPGGEDGMVLVDAVHDRQMREEIARLRRERGATVAAAELHQKHAKDNLARAERAEKELDAAVAALREFPFVPDPTYPCGSQWTALCDWYNEHRLAARAQPGRDGGET